MEDKTIRCFAHIYYCTHSCFITFKVLPNQIISPPVTPAGLKSIPAKERLHYLQRPHQFFACQNLTCSNMYYVCCLRTYLSPEDPQCASYYNRSGQENVHYKGPCYHWVLNVARRFIHDITVHGFHAKTTKKRRQGSPP